VLISAIAADVQSLLTTPSSALVQASELSALLKATRARAVGCWRHDAGVLHLAGFLAVEDMPAEVRSEFVAATRRVPLTHTEFGIVQAVAAGGPAVNHRAADPRLKPAGSIGWLGRFGAASSLATPITHGTELRGALAVATPSRIESDDAVWRLMAALAERLSEPKP
jgi:GAF domain-containing protein